MMLYYLHGQNADWWACKNDAACTCLTGPWHRKGRGPLRLAHWDGQRLNRDAFHARMPAATCDCLCLKTFARAIQWHTGALKCNRLGKPGEPPWPAAETGGGPLWAHACIHKPNISTPHGFLPPLVPTWLGSIRVIVLIFIPKNIVEAHRFVTCSCGRFVTVVLVVIHWHHGEVGGHLDPAVAWRADGVVLKKSAGRKQSTHDPVMSLEAVVLVKRDRISSRLGWMSLPASKKGQCVFFLQAPAAAEETKSQTKVKRRGLGVLGWGVPSKPWWRPSGPTSARRPWDSPSLRPRIYATPLTVN